MEKVHQIPQSLTLIKLGGALITDKTKPMTLRPLVLKRLVSEIVRAQKETSDLLVIGHGQGSFGHVPAHKYQTISGFDDDRGRLGMAITQDCAAQLNRLVVSQFLAANIPAVSYLFSNSLVTKETRPASWDPRVLIEYLAKGLLPVTGGDVIVDQVQGCTIWSTEKVLAHIAKGLPKEKFQVKEIIHVTEVTGVLDQSGQTIDEITPPSASQVKQLIGETNGLDVTGGMWHKIEESLQLLEYGIESKILSGLKPNNLYQALIGAKWQGTTIKN